MGALKVWDGSAWQTVFVQSSGLPPGGATNALLAKLSATDSDAAWTTAPVVLSISAGAVTVTSTLTFAEAANIATGTTTGTKFGTSNVQKLGWWGATPVVQSTGWSATAGYTADKSFNPQTTTLAEVANVLGTLIDALKNCGLLG